MQMCRYANDCPAFTLIISPFHPHTRISVHSSVFRWSHMHICRFVYPHIDCIHLSVLPPIDNIYFQAGSTVWYF